MCVFPLVWRMSCAYFVGFIYVLGAWSYLMPIAFNLGFFAKKSEGLVPQKKHFLTGLQV